MMNNNEKTHIDVEFTEESTINKQINGKPLYFTTSQVSQIINETDSTIRFWCNKFKDILHIETSGTHRRFKEEDIEQLKYIKKLLREENYTINQVVEYCSEKNTSVIKQKVDNQDPLAIKALATAMTIEIGGQLEDFKYQIMEQMTNEIQQNFIKQEEIQTKHQEELKQIHEQYQDQIKNLQEQHQEQLKEYVAVTMDEKLTEKINNQIGEVKSYMDEKEDKATKRDQEMIAMLRKREDERRKENELKEQEEKNKGFWGRLFGK